MLSWRMAIRRLRMGILLRFLIRYIDLPTERSNMIVSGTDPKKKGEKLWQI